MEYELFCVRICKGCAIRAMLLTAKGFQKVLKSISLSYTPVLQDIYDCIEMY